MRCPFSKEVLLFFSILLPFQVVYGGSIQLPKTGQTRCFDSSGIEIACATTGQDGEIQAGVQWPDPRFIDNGDGTITDMLTGLMWLKDANCANTIGYDPDSSGNGSMGWVNALAFISGINDGSVNISTCDIYTNTYSDWHLPNSNELASIVNYSVPDPSAWLNSAGFENVKPALYWSSTSGTYPYSGNRYGAALLIDMQSGADNGQYPKQYSPYNSYYTWPVRIDTHVSGPSQVWKTGQTSCYDENGNVINCTGTGQDGDVLAGVNWPSPRFKDNGDDTVTDNLTGLMWTKSNAVLGSSNTNWQNILNHVQEMNAGLRENFGYTDWRLPNLIENQSLFSRETDRPVLPIGHPFYLPLGYGTGEWTSTSLAGSEKSAWLTDDSWGPRVAYDKSESSGVGWPVRGGNIHSPTTFLLTFPLLGEHPDSVATSAILDHSGEFYKSNDIIEAYNGEIAHSTNGASCYKVKSSCIWGYRKDDMTPSVIPGMGDFLWYDGHSGYDFPKPKGTAIVAAASGTLCAATLIEAPKRKEVWRKSTQCPYTHDPINGPNGGNSWTKWHAIYIVHENGYTTWYLHSSELEPSVQAQVLADGYASVERGQQIALVGDTGVKGSYHLHFEARIGDSQSLDPYGWNGSPRLWSDR